MANIDARAERAMEEITGNEALLEMLDTDAATELLEWGRTMVSSIVKETDGMDDDAAADAAVSPRLKAVRQSMRSIGNWAAGKYTDPLARTQLRDKLLQNFQAVFGMDSKLPTAEEMDAVLNEVDDTGNTPLQLILKLKTILQTM